VSVTAPAGFVASAVPSGIKADGLLDLALVSSATGPIPAAGVFTRNRAMAAPVIISRKRLTGGLARAVVVNSGCANAGTGEAGLVHAEAITAAVAEHLGAEPDHVLACSTGPIGNQLPVTKVLAALPDLVKGLGTQGDGAAAAAILTTDSVPKTVVIDGDFVVGGMAKGAGMLRPDMATMLAILTTDAEASPTMLAGVLKEAVETTFNCLNVDGCESTNDTALLLASGIAGAVPEDALGEKLEAACRDLAGQLASDAEGATKVVRIVVRGATDSVTARQVGRAVADSALVRASFFGGDPNWGRVLAAAGTCPVEVGAIAYEGVNVYDHAGSVLFDATALAERLRGSFTVTLDLREGQGECEIVTTDLSPEYVRFNGERS